MTQREQVRNYLIKILRENKDDTDPLTDSSSLVLSGRLSSIDVVDTLTFLETTFGFSIDANDFDQAKFDSVDSIVALLSEAKC
jgi:acyl carrier protein